jgi:hypothetical protein
VKPEIIITVTMQRPAFIEPAPKSPVKKEEAFSMRAIEEADRKAYEYSLLDDPNTWKAHIREFHSQIQAIYRRTGMRGITANQLNEIERLEDTIRECLQILRSLK